MSIKPNFRLLQSTQLHHLHDDAQKQVLALREYIRVRKWAYSGYNELMERASNKSRTFCKRLLLNKDITLVSKTGEAIAAVYLCDELVTVYILPSITASKRLVKMQPKVVEALPTILTKEWRDSHVN